MPVDILTQTRDLVSRTDEQQQAIRLSEIIALAETAAKLLAAPDDIETVLASPSVPERTWWRNAGVAALAVAVVLVAVGSVAVLLRTTGPDATSPDGRPSSFENLSWRVIDDPALFGTGTAVYAVTASESMFVAVGADLGDDPSGICGPGCGPPRTGSAAVWTSQSGVEWERVPHEESVFGGPGGQAMWGVTAWDGGFVAVGADGTSPTLGNSEDWTPQDAAVWTSSNGVSWSRVPHDEAVLAGPGRQEMFDVAASDTGLVAIGFDEEGPMNGSPEDQAIWVSTDGTVWSQVLGFGVGWMNDVESAPQGFVGVGGLSGSAAWTSYDGLTWSLSPDSPLDRDGRFMASLARQRNRHVAVSGRGDGGDIVAWLSEDGINWAFLSQVYSPANAERFMPTGVAASSSGFVVVASDRMGMDSNSDAATAAAWTSTDGVSWTRAEGDEDLGTGVLWSVAASDTTVVAGGWSPDGAVIWVGSSQQPNRP